MMSTEKHETWVYGVIPAGVKLEQLERRRDQLPPDVRVVESGDLAAIVGDPPGDDAKAIRDKALAHARVLEVVVLDAPVVPFRFGTVVPDGVDRELLGPWHDELKQRLESVKDYVQLTLKATYHEDVVMREIVDGNPDIAQLRELSRQGDEITTRDIRVRLGELVAVALEQLRQRDSGTILERLSPLSAAYRIEPLEAEFMVLNAAFLVERRRMREFEDTAEAVAEEQVLRMHFKLLGPQPPFDFVNGGQPQWGS
jgi:hypothetical protein